MEREKMPLGRVRDAAAPAAWQDPSGGRLAYLVVGPRREVSGALSLGRGELVVQNADCLRRDVLVLGKKKDLDLTALHVDDRVDQSIECRANSLGGRALHHASVSQRLRQRDVVVVGLGLADCVNLGGVSAQPAQKWAREFARASETHTGIWSVLAHGNLLWAAVMIGRACPTCLLRRRCHAGISVRPLSTPSALRSATSGTS